MLKTLIENQKNRIDAHKWGTGESILWDSTSEDIHIDKETNRQIAGQSIKVRIRIPINSERPISVEIIGKVRKKPKALILAERQILKEIFDAFSDKRKREAFIDDLIMLMDNYKSQFSSLERARIVVKRLANHFGLPDNIQQEMTGYTYQKLAVFGGLFKATNRTYFVNLYQNSIIIGQMPEQSKGLINRKRK